MGDRVLIQLIDESKEVSPVLYMHWAGQEAPDYIRECAALMADRTDDLPYAFGRMVGIAHTHIPGNLSLGVWNNTQRLTPDDTHYDAGIYIVHCYGEWEVEAFGGYGKPFKCRVAETA